MTSSTLQILQTLMGQCWRFFNSWHIPGTNVTPAAFLIFLMVAPMSLKFFKSILGLSEDAVKAGKRI